MNWGVTKLEEIGFERFRSIEDGKLVNCGSFNVLIGQNNSGKSNILAVIDAFFTCVRSGPIVVLDPPIGEEIDFFRKEIHTPIEISLVFSLSPTERDRLMSDIVDEAPQMRNAVDSIDPTLRISVSLKVVPPPNNFAYISKIALIGTETEREILTISSEAAVELRDLLARSRQLRTAASELNRVKDSTDSDDWRRMMRVRADSPDMATRYILPPGTRSDVAPIVESIVLESSSYEDFTREVDSLASKRLEESESLEDQPLDRNTLGTFSGEQPSVPLYIENLLHAVAETKVLHLADRREQIGQREAQQLLSLKVRRGRTHVFTNIQQTVDELLGVRIDAFEGEASSRRGETIAEMDVDDFLVEVNGSGIKEALRLILDVEFGEPAILLVEEPEIHLHPALEIGMMQYLKQVSADCQVFITTHSTNFLDSADMRNVYLVSKDNSTQTQLLDSEGAESQIPEELGIRLSSLFMFDRLVFVEGSSDEAILREWASKLGVNFGQCNVGFIIMDGVRNLRHFAVEATLDFLKKRQVKMWFLLDRDEKDEPEVTKIEESVGENAVVKVLGRREIENYLIVPRAVAEFIKVKNSLAGNASSAEMPSEDDVATKLSECAEGLKETAVYKRMSKILSKPVYPLSRMPEVQKNEATDAVLREVQEMIDQLEEAKTKINDVHLEQSEHLEKSWESRKLDIVPGDALLDNVCSCYGVRFKKERDSTRLAALMESNEIDAQIERIIREIGE